MNELAKIQLFHIAATMPWAEVATTQKNIKLIYYEDDKENAKKTVLVFDKEEAADIAKALKLLIENYCHKEEGDEL